MKVYFVDETDRKAAPSWAYIATSKRLQYLEDLLNNEWKTHKKLSDLRAALDVIRSTPMVPSTVVSGSYQMGQHTQYAPQDVYALLTAANFNLALQSHQINTSEDVLRLSLETGPSVIQAMKLWNRMWDQVENGNGDNPLFALQGISRHQAIQKGLKDGKITIENFVPRNDFASTESFALFTGLQTKQGWKEGYLNASGNLVPLSQAKLYDSLGSAESAMGRSYSVSHYSEVQIVRLNLAVSGIEGVLKSSLPGVTSNLSNSCIQTVAADVQKQTIQNALQKASDEQLREQWEERQSPTIKRKM